MLSKQFAYLLFGIIALLSVLFGFNVFMNYKKNQNSEEKINTIISKFEEKFKADSIYLAKANKMLIDKISQKVIDSVSNVYEEKLKIALAKAQKYEELLIANNIALTPKNTNASNITVTKTISTNPNNVAVNTPATKLNVISYKQLSKNLKEKSTRKETNLNVTTYSKIAQNKSKTVENKNSNVTTYSKLNKRNNTNFSKYSQNTSTKQITYKKQPSKSSIKPIINPTTKIIHNNYLLDHAENINEIDQSPIYPGCEYISTNSERKKCFATKISRYILDHFQSSNFNNKNLKKGLNKVRVLFIIDENGYPKFGKLTEQWPNEVYLESKRVIESTPKMIAGKSHNKNVPVKYSLLIPFIYK